MDQDVVVPSLTGPQIEFIQDVTTPNLLLCGGYGSGKSHAGALKAISLALQMPGTRGIIGSPNYSVAEGSMLPIMQTLLRQMNIKHKLHGTKLIFTIPFADGRESYIQIKSLDNPKLLVGATVAYAIVDELDRLDAEDAREAWENLSARVRDPNAPFTQMAATTTPEGFRFAWQFWVRDVEEGKATAQQRRIIRAPTWNASHVKDEYIKRILATHSNVKAKAYLNGDFVNFSSGTVYLDFDREANHTDYTHEDVPSDRPLMIGMDFNRRGLSAIVMGYVGGVRYDGFGHAIPTEDTKVAVVDELIGPVTTPEATEQIKARYPGRRIVVFPDPGSRAEYTSAMGMTDYAHLQRAGFTVHAPQAHPEIKDRVNSVNAMFCNTFKRRTLFVNTKRAPILTRCLEQQTYDKHGKPVKDVRIDPEVNIMIDDPVDALGYAVMFGGMSDLIPHNTVTVS